MSPTCTTASSDERDQARPSLRLEPLYRVRFTYPESWMVGLGGGWEQHLYLAEGRCEGTISGRFRGANFPRRQGAAGHFGRTSAP